jgi:hypothetical protein
MKNFGGYLLLILCLGLACAAPALADTTYLVYEQYGGTWQDANKTASPDDNLMCWAAAASNVLNWGNWVTSQYNTAQSIFQYFVDHWTDKAGYMYWAYNWWLNGTPPSTTLYAYPDVPGGNFFPTKSASSYEVNASGVNLMSTADSLLHKGDGVTMTIRTSSGGAHAVTLWGYSYSSPGVYTGVYITDSDDGYFGLRNYALTLSGTTWYLGGGYSGWYISDLEALAMENAVIDPSPTPDPAPVKKVKIKPAKGDGFDDPAAVPIAPSWVLFGTGMVSFYFLRRGRPAKKESRAREEV